MSSAARAVVVRSRCPLFPCSRVGNEEGHHHKSAPQRTAPHPFPKGSGGVACQPPLVLHRQGLEVMPLTFRASVRLRLTSSSVQLLRVSQSCGLENDPGAQQTGMGLQSQLKNQEQVASRWTKLPSPFAVDIALRPALTSLRFRTRVSSVTAAYPVPALTLHTPVHTHKDPLPASERRLPVKSGVSRSVSRLVTRSASPLLL